MFFKYNEISKTLETASVSVKNKDWELKAELCNEYQYPYHGWYWFEDESNANEFFDIKNKL